MNLFIISGRSGSGKTIALRALEDLGFYCVDNIPINLLPALTHITEKETNNVAVSVDVRNIPKEATDFNDIVDFLPDIWKITIIFLDSSDEVLIKRYSETRRIHPLNRLNLSLEELVSEEKVILTPIAESSDLYINTDNLSLHELSELIRERVLGKKSSNIVLVFESFGYKFGIPQDADYVFDARFLPNPHWVPELKKLTGFDEPVQAFLGAEPIVTKFIWQIQNLISTWLPHLERNNRSYVNIAIGCTGGKHRSVYVAESLAKYFRNSHGNVQIRHRQTKK